MNPSIELTLEQEFSLREFTDQVRRMSREQAQEFLIVQQRLMLVQKTMYQDLLKHEWKLEPNSTLSDANLDGAHLSEANLTGATLQGVNMDMTGLSSTIMPDGSIHD
jgi:uncharacterized protein YjbI with pentapeptide repeats